MDMEKLKLDVNNMISKKGDLTIDDICRELNYEDDFEVTAAIARLELDGEIISSGEKVVYRQDGAAILLATYGRRHDYGE